MLSYIQMYVCISDIPVCFCNAYRSIFDKMCVIAWCGYVGQGQTHKYCTRISFISRILLTIET